jgi:hypothetical protein
MLTNEDRHRLEKWIDDESVSDVIDEISSICFNKGEKFEELEWTNLGEYLEKIAEKIDAGKIP